MPTYKLKIDGTEYDVTVTPSALGGAQVTVEGQTFTIETIGPQAPTLPVAAAAPTAPAPVVAAPAPVASGAGGILAPIPGVITRVLVKVGDQVQANQVVVKLEAMKMENDIASPTAGTVSEVAVSEGAEVSQGQLLVKVG